MSQDSREKLVWRARSALAGGGGGGGDVEKREKGYAGPERVEVV